MLAQLRRQTKIILWVVVVGFVGFMFFDWGMNRIRPGAERAGLVGKVGKDRITTEEFRQEYRNQRAAYYEQFDVNPSIQTEQEIADRTWETLLQRHLLWEEAAEHELLPSDDEVLLEIQNNPPAFIRSQPIFQTDSVFDHSKYVAALGDPNIDLRFLEDYVRTTLPYQKLREYMASSVRVTREEARTFLTVIQEQVAISYLVSDPLRDVTESIPEPTEQELADYYSSQKEAFRVPEKRVLAYVEIPLEPSAEDRLYARTKIEDAEALVEADEPFDEIATHYSDDSSARRGGDLGWVKPGRLPAELDSVAGELEVGEASGIVETEAGFHILRLDDKRTENGVEEWKVSQIVASLQASPLTIENIREDLFELVEKGRNDGFETAAEELGFELKVGQEMVKSQIVPFLGLREDDADRIFGAEEGSILGPAEGSDRIYAMMLAEIVPARTPSLTEIKDFVKQSYTRSVRKKKAKALAERALANIRGGESLEQTASDMGLTFEQTQPFTRLAFVPGIGKENIVIANAFALEEGQVSGVLEYSDQFYIIRVDEKILPDEEQLGTDLANLRMSVINTKQQAYLADWYEGLKEQVPIEDYRTLAPY